MQSVFLMAEPARKFENNVILRKIILIHFILHFKWHILAVLAEGEISSHKH